MNWQVELPGRHVDRDVLSGLRMLKVLARVDFPLLVLAQGPPVIPRSRRKTSEDTSSLPPTKWLLNWFDAEEESPARTAREGGGQGPRSIYAAVRVSEERLEQFLGNHLSLREALLHCEFAAKDSGVYLYTARTPLKPLEVRALDPRSFPRGFVPARHFALNGKEVFNLDQGNVEAPIKLGFHIISKSKSGDQLSWATSGPFQTLFQRFLFGAAHFIQRRDVRKSGTLTERDWAALNTRLAIGGSYRIFCAGNTEKERESAFLAAACERLKAVTEIETNDTPGLLAELPSGIGPVALDDLYSLLNVVSVQGVAVTIEWEFKQAREELLLNKRVADEAISHLRKEREKRSGRATLTVELTPEEAEYLSRPVMGSGGWQSSLRKIQGKIKGTTLSLTADEVDKIVKQAQSYGQGGFQDRLWMVIQAIRRWETSFSGIS